LGPESVALLWPEGNTKTLLKLDFHREGYYQKLGAQTYFIYPHLLFTQGPGWTSRGHLALEAELEDSHLKTRSKCFPGRCWWASLFNSGYSGTEPYIFNFVHNRYSLGPSPDWAQLTLTTQGPLQFTG